MPKELLFFLPGLASAGLPAFFLVDRFGPDGKVLMIKLVANREAR